MNDLYHVYSNFIYCVDTYDGEGDIQGSLRNDYYSNNKEEENQYIILGLDA